MGAVRLQLVRVALPIYTDHEPELACCASSDAGNRILDHHRTPRHYAEHFRSLQVAIGRWLTGQILLEENMTIHTRVEKILDLCRVQHGLAILTRRHHCGFNAHLSQILDASDRAWKRLNTGLGELLVN